MTSTQTDSDKHGDHINILVVEDDVHLLSGIREVLELEKYNVMTAENGWQALDIMRSDANHPPDMIISDIMMPVMDGFEFLSEVRNDDRWVEVPFIFLTAKGEKSNKHQGVMMGADVYLTKPFEAEELLVAVKARLRRHQSMQRVKKGEVTDIKQKILTILNHEFRTPLTLVVAYAEMLRDFDPGNMQDDEIMSFLHGVNSGADRLRRLVENFILLVEIDTGEAAETYRWRRSPVLDMQTLVNEAVREASTNHEGRECQIRIDPGMPPPVADAQKLRIIIRELVDNAFKFSGIEDAVIVAVERSGDDMRIQVKDHGRGMAKEDQNNIWQTFYQTNRELYEDQGAGSGLAIVDGLTRLHGGECEIESQVGVGTTVTVRIPLVPPDADSADED